MSKSAAQLYSRRSFCVCCAVAAGVSLDRGWLKPAEAFAEARNIVDTIRDAAATTPLKIHKLRENISVLEGSGGNIAVLTGSDGKLFVDAGIAVSRPRILEASGALGPQPIKHLINTHWHFDHTDGNRWINEEGAAILGHENTHKHLLSSTNVKDWNYTFPTPPLAAVPTETFASTKSVEINRSAISLEYYGPAHTDSDISVTFVNADIIHCGDTYWNGFYPFIDYSTGGSIDGMIKAAETNIAAVGPDTIVIPGHNLPDRASATSNKAELIVYRDMLAAIREKVSALKKSGRSLDETIAAKPTAAFDEKWGTFLITPDLFTRLVYAGV